MFLFIRFSTHVRQSGLLVFDIFLEFSDSLTIVSNLKYLFDFFFFLR